MNARMLKAAIGGGALAVVGLAMTYVVAHAVTAPSTAAQLRSQRDATIAALKAAIARGDDGIGALPGGFVEDDGDDPKADDPLLRALWTRLNNGPTSPQSVAHLFQEAARQRQREQAYGAAARRLSNVGRAPTLPTTLQWSRLGPQSALSEWNGSYFDGMDSGRIATGEDPTGVRFQQGRQALERWLVVRFLAGSRTSRTKIGRQPDTQRRNLTRLRRDGVGSVLAISAGMSLPREVVPGQFYMITRRCQQRQFLLRPDAATNNAFTYCLIEAAQRCQVEVVLPCAMSNHYHAVIFDRYGRYPEFMEHFHKMFARSQNALRGRWENLWSSEPACVVKLVGREAVMDKLVYTATNPVQAHLVERAHQWPGINGLSAVVGRRPVRARRPWHFFRPEGPMPKDVEMRFAIPPELGPEVEVLAELRERVRGMECELAGERQRTGRRVVGRRAVLAASWRSQPAGHEPRRNLRPRVATRSKWARIEAVLRNRAFVAAYASARERWQEGLPVVFPAGTYWLRRFAQVPVAET